MNTSKKNILILHAHNTFNNGSFMMLINFIAYFSPSNPDHYSFFVELQSDEDQRRLATQTNQKFNIIRLAFNITSHEKMGFLKKTKALYHKLFTHTKRFEALNISAIIILGGDDLSEYYKGWQVAADLYRIKRYAKKFPVYLVGQTIGPFKSWRNRVAKNCLKNTHLFFRDPLSMELYNNEIGSGCVKLGADLALLDLPHVQSLESAASLEVNPNKFITLVPSGFYQLFCQEKEAYLICWQQIIMFLLTEPRLENFKLLLLPHVTRPEDDRKIILELIEMTPKAHRGRLIFEDKEYTPQEARELIGASYFTLSGRMHAIISSLQQLKPAIPLSYSLKFEGVIAHALNQPTLLVDASQPECWTKGTVVNQTVSKILFLLDHYAETQQKISVSVSSQKSLALTQLYDISSEIENQ